MRLRDARGRPRLCSAGFFARADPGRAWSVRLHDATLAVEGTVRTGGPRSMQGLESKSYRWVRMEDGVWDRAFAANGCARVGLGLAGTPFGAAKFVGNTMLGAAPGSTMADAYDAWTLLGPIDELRLSGTTGFYVTPELRPEPERRIRLVEGDGLACALAAGTPARRNGLLDPPAKP